MRHEPNIEISLVSSPINVDLASDLRNQSCGAVSVFIGNTRSDQHPKLGELVALTYHCYESMAITSLRTIACDAASQFLLNTIRITHSIAIVPVDEPSVVIAVGSDCRDDAFQACRFLIDELKARVPIWKQEQWRDGTTWSKGAPLNNMSLHSNTIAPATIGT